MPCLHHCVDFYHLKASRDSSSVIFSWRTSAAPKSVACWLQGTSKMFLLFILIMYVKVRCCSLAYVCFDCFLREFQKLGFHAHYLPGLCFRSCTQLPTRRVLLFPRSDVPDALSDPVDTRCVRIWNTVPPLSIPPPIRRVTPAFLIER